MPFGATANARAADATAAEEPCRTPSAGEAFRRCRPAVRPDRRRRPYPGWQVWAVQLVAVAADQQARAGMRRGAVPDEDADDVLDGLTAFADPTPSSLRPAVTDRRGSRSTRRQCRGAETGLRGLATAAGRGSVAPEPSEVDRRWGSVPPGAGPADVPGFGDCPAPADAARWGCARSPPRDRPSRPATVGRDGLNRHGRQRAARPPPHRCPGRRPRFPPGPRSGRDQWETRVDLAECARVTAAPQAIGDKAVRRTSAGRWSTRGRCGPAS